jgi:hypothetical protein
VAGDDGELLAIVDELYGLDLDEFTAARNAKAKELGKGAPATLLKALGKPVTAAWLVNQLVRRHRADVEQFLALGAAFRTAQAEGAGDELRALNKQRQESLAALGKPLRELMAGHPAGDDVQRAVEDTWRAALMDVAAARAVLSGRLMKPLAAAGFGSVDLTGALAAPDLPTPELPEPAATPIRSGARRSATASADASTSEDATRARAQVAAARAAARRAAEQVAAAERKAESAVRLRDRLAAEVERLTATLQRAEEELAQAEDDLSAANDAVAEARRLVEEQDG